MTCSECKYWWTLPNSASEGMCRRYPRFMYSGRNVMDMNEWCGEFVKIMDVVKELKQTVLKRGF